VNFALLGLIGLISLFLVAQITTYIFGILSDRFYAPFHFLAGVMLGLLFYSITLNGLATILISLSIGTLWEVYEYLMWKFVLKKKIYKPKKSDTIADFCLDFLGVVVGIFCVIYLG